MKKVLADRLKGAIESSEEKLFDGNAILDQGSQKSGFAPPESMGSGP